MHDALLFFGIVVVGLIAWLAFQGRRHHRTFRRKAVLTGADAEIFRKLREVFPECVVAPHVAVSSLIEPAGSVLARRNARRTLEGQHVDCAIFDDKLSLLAVIAIGHRARPTRREARLARSFASAGVHAIRLQPGRPYSALKIRKLVFGIASKRGSRRPTAEDTVQQPRRTPVAPWRNTLNAHV